MRYLGDRWQTALAGVPKLRLLTPRDPARSFGTASIAVDGLTSKELFTQLRETHGIATQAKNGRHSPFTEAIRVSPAAHSSLAEVDRFVEAVSAIARRA
jgi:selenocysteine lyase/cysteine desulfurase